MPQIRAKMLMCPNAFDQRLLSTGSRTINSVAQTLKIISGRKRIASVELKPMLTGTGNLRIGMNVIRAARVSKRFLGGAESRGMHLYPERHIHLRLLEHPRGGLAD